jgi:hypothetical protein
MGISKMDYRDMLGIPSKPKKKVEKKIAPKPTVPPVTELLKKEFGQLNEWGKVNPGPKRWTKKMGGEGLTEFEELGGKDNVNEATAYKTATNNELAMYISHLSNTINGTKDKKMLQFLKKTKKEVSGELKSRKN